ncbi:MAG: cell division protein FtsZ [Fimbriimonadaceae bacterium]|nr:cell division protein FtsZ [Fimbriimonadaceae bacterium]
MQNVGAVIKVIGVGGGGCNAVNRMVESGIQGVEFIAMNTDVQVLDKSLASKKIQLGPNMSRGLGAGGDPEVGKASAEESKNEIRKIIEGSDMVFITAGMGGGTGTGAAPVIAELARELGAVTVAIVTKPFLFEGARRSRLAENGVTGLIGRVDTMITIPNDRLSDVVERKTTLTDSFRVADDVLRQGVQGISDIITVPGQINVDFADVKAVMMNAGPALMGIGYGVGEHRALQAAQQATSSALLEQTIDGARGLLVNVTSGEDLTLSEVNEAMGYIHSLCDSDDANIFFGTVVDPSLEGEVRITVLATGFTGEPSKATSSGAGSATSGAVTRIPAYEEVVEEIKPAERLERPNPVTQQRSSIKDIWEKASAQQRESTPAPEDVYDDSEIDIPAFLRQHKKVDKD